MRHGNASVQQLNDLTGEGNIRQSGVLAEVGDRDWSPLPTCAVGEFDPAAGWW